MHTCLNFNRSQDSNGFTIIELLIVVVVIAILATITIVGYRGIQDRAHNSATVSNIRNTANVLEMYKSENNQYPQMAACFGLENSDFQQCNYYESTSSECTNDDKAQIDSANVSAQNTNLKTSEFNDIIKNYFGSTPKNIQSKKVRLYIDSFPSGCAVYLVTNGPSYSGGTGYITINAAGDNYSISSNPGNSYYYIAYTISGDSACTLTPSTRIYYPGENITRCTFFGGDVR